MDLSINGKEYRDISIESLAHSLASVEEQEYSEIWLSETDGASLCCLKNRDKCWLMYLRHEGDSGFSTRNRETDKGGKMAIKLSNGQVDYYAQSWTIPYEIGKSALEYFWFTKAMDTRLDWHEE